MPAVTRKHWVCCIISGGQTGVDRGALDAAMALRIAHGGWCPAGRLAENGLIPAQYALRETISEDHAQRTEKNVFEADATLILCCGQLTGGTELTSRLAHKYKKPCLVVDLSYSPNPNLVWQWLQKQAVTVINVAGPRESHAPGIALAAQRFLSHVFSLDKGGHGALGKTLQGN